MDGCIFCKIVKKEIPAIVLYEDEKVMAFKDINPEAPVHIVIVPKKHVSGMKEIDESNISIISDIHLTAIKIAKEQKIYDTGFRLINNCGENAGQTIFHLHYHLLGGKNLGQRLLS